MDKMDENLMRCVRKRESGCQNYLKKNWVAGNGP